MDLWVFNYLLRTSSHPMMSSSSTKWASSLVLLSPLAGPMSDEAVTMTVCFQCVGGANGLVLRTTPLGSNWQSAMRPQELDFILLNPTSRCGCVVAYRTRGRYHGCFPSVSPRQSTGQTWRPSLVLCMFSGRTEQTTGARPESAIGH